MKKNFLFLLSTVIVLTFISCNHENGNNNQTLEVEIIHNAVTDFDGNSYDAVRIGNQVWMAENLKFDAPYSVCYDKIDGFCDTFGRFYSLHVNGEFFDVFEFFL